jgi:hypothetical protein
MIPGFKVSRLQGQFPWTIPQQSSFVLKDLSLAAETADPSLRSG